MASCAETEADSRSNHGGVMPVVSHTAATDLETAL